MKRKKIWWVIIFVAFIVFSLSLKRILLPFAIEIVQTIEKSIPTTNSGLLVIAAVKTIIYEGTKDLPVFLFAYSITFYYFKKSKLVYKLSFLILINISLYIINLYIYENKPELMIAFFLILSQLVLMVVFHKSKENFFSSIFVLVQVNFAFYGLLVATILNYLGVGKRDLINSIKISAGFLSGNTILNFVSLSFFIPLMMGGVFITLLTILYSRRLESEKREKQKERELRLVRLVAEEAQVWQELHYLVHDLKSPLMTMAGLNSLIEMQVGDSRLREYCRRISEAVETINEMISEFLNNEKRKITTIEELIKFVRAHVVVKNADPKVNFTIEKGLPSININRIRMARALINVIENAIRAVASKDDPLISINVRSSANNNNNVVFSIKDNGTGISEEDLEKIWNVGFTTNNSSSGLGMSFVKKVIENHQGKIKINSKVGQGTEAIIILPGVTKE